MYRRFPDKAALADALFEQRIDVLAEVAERAEADADPWRALLSFLEQAAAMLAADRGLRQILMFAGAGHQRCGYARERMRPPVQRLLARAQAAGQVRPDLAATDIPLIEFLLATAAEYCQPVRPDAWRRYLTLIVDGLRPARDSVSPMPVRPLDPGELADALNANVVSQLQPRPQPGAHGPG